MNTSSHKIRPGIWYKKGTNFSNFKCLEDFISAIESVIYHYFENAKRAENWKKHFIKSYKKFYAVQLEIPNWNEIADKYDNRA